MRFALEAAGLVIILLVPLCLLVILLFKILLAEKNMQQVAVNLEMKRRRGNLPQGICFVEFVNVENGFRIYKTFRNRLIVGRRMDEAEPIGVMFLESEPTISRKQLRITETSEGMVVENLSGVNITRLNGMPLGRPAILRAGDFITAGSQSYIVSGMIRSA